MSMTAIRRLAAAGAVLVATVVAVAAPGAAPTNSYKVTPLDSNVPGAARFTDPNLVNGWGLTFNGTSPWWVSDNGTNKTTLYNGNTGAAIPLVVDVAGGPTGAVGNSGAGFKVSSADGARSSVARFIFSTEAGTIRGWDPTVALNDTEVAVTVPDAVFKGLAIATLPDGSQRLYATDFHNAQVDVWDGTWKPITGGFVDQSVPGGYAPFGIQTIGDRVFVTYAPQDADAHDEVAGQGHGIVDAYDLEGNLLARVAQHGQLNAPWGLALAPATFGEFGGDLLVGNFGDGQINAYEELPNGHFEHRGELRDASGGTLVIDGLWALEFGNGAMAGPKDTLFFTAGPDDESNGLFGTITPS
jgi:uncharacterized protein (TIGR03118 family)